MRTQCSALLSLALLAAPAFAQTPPGLVGLTRNLPLVLSVDTGTCLAQRCVPVFPTASTQPAWAGGTAYDPVRGGTWITNGVAIAEVGQGTCATLCPVQPVPLSSPNAVATGLAYNESAGTLFVSDSLNNILTVKVSGCNLTVLNTCQTWPVSTTNPTIGGLATDDVNGLIFYSGSMWSGAPNNIIFVAKQSTPCQYFCKIVVPSCTTGALGPITGLAHDCCKNVLWATDGINWLAMAYNLATCSGNVVSCCRLPFTTEPLIGLCMLPSIATSKDQTAASKSCTAPICPSCPTMEHTMVGQPTIGNPGFTLRLDNAPATSTGVLVLNLGACGAGVPFGCGQIFVPTAGWVVLGPFGTGGGVGCTGGNALTLSLAPNPWFCGFTFSTQYAVICIGGGAFGTALSNCLSWAISAT